MPAHSSISSLFAEKPVGRTVTVKGWVRTFRNDQFVSVNDGSTIRQLQVVIDPEKVDESVRKRIQTGACIAAQGTLEKSLGKGQDIELICVHFEILGDSDPQEYPIQMKRHTLEFLREKAHLRFRTNTFAAVFRIRHHLQFAIHKYFNLRTDVPCRELQHGPSPGRVLDD
jgi:asparaginyl-tRNA synthetase